MPLSSKAAQLLRASILAALFWPALVLAGDTLVYPGKSWTQAARQTTGWSAEKLQAADDVARSIGTSAYLVVHKGVVVHAFGPVNQPMNLASARKSVLSVLYGIAVDRHQIDLDKTLADLGITDKGGLSETERKATVRRLDPLVALVHEGNVYESKQWWHSFALPDAQGLQRASKKFRQAFKLRPDR
jgi:CubicO group peptidase (beta-lactamase class C family)